MKTLTAIAFAAGILPCSVAAAEGDKTVTVKPQRTGELFPNPGMGWQTFHHFADDDKNLADLPSTSAYFRLYWSEIEPEEGRIDFPHLDGLLKRARQAGQKLAFRVMCAGTSRQEMYVPRWLRGKGCPGFEYKYHDRGPTHWIPDMDHVIFQNAHFRLIGELGKRYDGHPDVDLLDIGSVGLWGEWHMSGTGLKVPSLKTRLALIDAWCRAFPKTPKVMLIGDADGMKHATASGCGWRADCLGDMGGFSKTWNHMEHFYKQQIRKTDTQSAWRKAPVAFESCWDMRKWQAEGWDIRFIFDYALELHASYLNNKSAPIPAGTRDEIERFLRRIGYRLVLRQLQHARRTRARSNLAVSMQWENAGVAPPYRDYVLAFRLKREEQAEKGQAPSMVTTRTSIKGWQPGRFEVSATLRLPGDLEPGRYELALGLVDPSTGKPSVRLAIVGRAGDGWYPLSHIEVAGAVGAAVRPGEVPGEVASNTGRHPGSLQGGR